MAAMEDKDAGGGGGTTMAIVFWMSAWYVCSLVTLFMNKTILTTLGGDKYILGITQMVMTATLGAIKVYGPDLVRAVAASLAGDGGADSKRSPQMAQYKTFWRDMVLVGIMRGLTVIFGLVSLSHVAVSFTETVKSSAPFFTVIFAAVILGQRTSWQVNLSLVPVMLGLALSSATELSFDTIGFMAAISNNVIDCVQNVFSKKLLRSMSPVQLQFYTSAAAALLQLPLLVYFMAPSFAADTTADDRAPADPRLAKYLIVDAVFYHMQSVTAYYTMSLLSPVSQSVANTAKRALLIGLSILYFGNPITAASAVGMLTVVAGVFLYNHARMNYPYRETSVIASRSGSRANLQMA